MVHKISLHHIRPFQSQHHHTVVSWVEFYCNPTGLYITKTNDINSTQIVDINNAPHINSHGQRVSVWVCGTREPRHHSKVVKPKTRTNDTKKLFYQSVHGPARYSTSHHGTAPATSDQLLTCTELFPPYGGLCILVSVGARNVTPTRQTDHSYHIIRHLNSFRGSCNLTRETNPWTQVSTNK